MRVGNPYLPQSLHKTKSQSYANKSDVFGAQYVDALNSDFISSWFYDRDDFTFDDDDMTQQYIQRLYNNEETKAKIDTLYNEQNPDKKDITGMRGRIDASNNVMSWAQSNRELVVQQVAPIFYEKRLKELEQKKQARKTSLQTTRRNMMETEQAYEEAGGSWAYSVLSGMGAYMTTPTGVAEALLPLAPVKQAARVGSIYAKTRAGIGRRAKQAFVAETAMVAGIESIIGVDEYLRNKDLGMTDERIIQDAVGRLATPFLAGALRGTASRVIDEINLWGVHGKFTNQEKTFMRDVLISDGMSRQDAEIALQSSLKMDKKTGRKTIKKNANKKVKDIADAIENGTAYRVKASILTDEAKTRLGIKADETIEVDAADLHNPMAGGVRVKYQGKETLVDVADIQKERELEGDIDFTPGTHQYHRVVISPQGLRDDRYKPSEEIYGKLSEDEIDALAKNSLDAYQRRDGSMVLYVKEDATDLYGRNILKTYENFDQEGDGLEWPDIREMVTIRKDKFDSVRNEFGTQVKRIYKDGEAAKKLIREFYNDEFHIDENRVGKLIEVGDSYLVDVNKLSAEAKLALAFPEMLSRQENILPLLFADVRGRKVRGFQMARDRRIQLYNKAKLDENGAFVLFNLKPEGDAAGNVPHRVIYSDGKGDKKNSIVVYRSQRNLWEDDKQLDIGAFTGVGPGDVDGVYTSSTFEGNKGFIKALGPNESVEDTSLGYSYELVVGREDGKKLKMLNFESKMELNDVKNLAKVIRKNTTTQEKDNFHLKRLLEKMDNMTETNNMTWGDFYYTNVRNIDSAELREFMTRFYQDAGFDVIVRKRGLKNEETILLNQNLIREVRVLNVQRRDLVDIERLPFPYETNDIFKGGRIIKLPVANKSVLSKIKQGIKGIIKSEEIDDDTISGMVIGGKYNEETGLIEGDPEFVDMGMFDLILNDIEPRVIHIPGIANKEFTEMEVNAMKFYYELVLDSTLTSSGQKMNLLGLLKKNRIYPNKANKEILYNIFINKSQRNMADYRASKNLEMAMDILDGYDKNIFNTFGEEGLAETISAISKLDDETFNAFNEVYLSIEHSNTKKIFFAIIDKDEDNVLRSLIGRPDLVRQVGGREIFKNNLVLLKNVLESDSVSRRKDIGVLPKKELDRIYNKYIAIKQFIGEMEADLKSTPAQWKVIAALLKGGDDTTLFLVQFDEVLKVLRDPRFKNMKTADDVKKAFMEFEPLPVNDEGRIVLSNEFLRTEAKVNDDGKIEFVKTKELTVLDERTKKYIGISDRAIIKEVDINKYNNPVISVLYKKKTHEIELNDYVVVKDKHKEWQIQYKNEVIFHGDNSMNDSLLRVVLHKYENTSRLTGKTVKFEEVLPGEVWKHVDKLGRRFNITKISDANFDLSIDGKSVANGYESLDDLKKYVGVLSREVDLEKRDTDELANSVYKCTLKF